MNLIFFKLSQNYPALSHNLTPKLVTRRGEPLGVQGFCRPTPAPKILFLVSEFLFETTDKFAFILYDFESDSRADYNWQYCYFYL